MSLDFWRDAITDLARIQRYIGERNPQAAERMTEELIAACEKHEVFPERGRRGRREGTRELTTVWPYVIVYRHTSGHIDILRIWHGRQERGR